MTKEKKDPRLELSTWVKPNKTEIKLNGFDDTIKMAESLGWKNKAAMEAEAAKKAEEAKKAAAKKAAVKKAA